MPRVQQLPAQSPPAADQAAALRESQARLTEAVATLSLRLRVVAEGIRDGKSYSEIGAALGVSKQAAHKLAGPAIASLREALAAMGFSGLDTLGLLKSQSKSGSAIPPQAIQKPSHLPVSSDSSPQVDDKVQRELGRGGCGAVYLATPKVGGDPVAVKLMLSRAQAEPRAIEQFKREMQVIAGLQHPNIVRFLDSGSDQGTFFFFFFISAFQFFSISAFTQKFPYRFDSKRDPIDIILNENPVPIRDRMPGLAKELSAVIDKALVRNPKNRFPDAGKLLASLPK